MGQDLVSPADDAYSLDQVALLWQEYLMRRARLKRDEEWCDTFVETVKQVAGDAKEFTFAGRKVATLVPGQVNAKRLERELPHVHQRFMRMVSKHQFDKGSFEREEPDLFDQYRARRFCVTDE